jgi:hypothetical protein
MDILVVKKDDILESDVAPAAPTKHVAAPVSLEGENRRRRNNKKSKRKSKNNRKKTNRRR